MAKLHPAYKPVGEDDYGRRDFLNMSVAMIGGAGFATTLGSLFSKVRADEENPAPKGGPYKSGKNETVKTGEFFFPRLKFHVRDRKMDIWDVGPSGDVILRRKLTDSGWSIRNIRGLGYMLEQDKASAAAQQG